MTTRIVKINPLDPERSYLNEAADILRFGGLVVIPTETVYGIAANALDKRAVERLYKIKKRPAGKPFSWHIERKEVVRDFAADIPVAAYKLMDKFWPGPLTMILKAKDKEGAIGLRVPNDDIASRIIAYSAVPLACPSANISGEPAPVNFEQAIKDLRGLVDFALDAGPTKLQIESSVVDLTVEPWQILREAAIKKEAIEAVAGKKIVLFVCTGNSCRSVMAEALLNAKLKEQGRQEVMVLSAGITPLSGMGATEATKEVLRKEGIDVSAYRSQALTTAMVNKSDIILVMEKVHEERVLKLAPQAKNRVFLLKEFAKIKDGPLDIGDPIGNSAEYYQQILKVIKEAVGRVAGLI